MCALLLICTLVACNNLLLVVLGKTFDSVGVTFCDLQLNGQIYCWGDGTSGQLGNGVYDVSLFPVKMLHVQYATDVSVGPSHTCIVDQGKAKCTGNGELLGRSSSMDITNTLVDVEGMDYPVETVVEVFARSHHSCLVTSSGGAKCWGRVYKGQLGNSEAVEYNKTFPVTGFETSGVSSMALASEHTCLLNTLGKVYCAGDNRSGQLGRGYWDDNVNIEMQPIVGETVMVSISAGSLYTCALSSTATVYCWGHGGYGQLGQGDTESRYAPTIVPGLSNVALINCNAGHTYVLLKYDQGVKLFGGSFDSLSPRTIFASENNIVDIKGGGEHVVCIKLASGAIRCAYYNGFGQLGNGAPLGTISNDFVNVLYLPITSAPTALPTASPTLPTAAPTASPTLPTAAPTVLPTASPTLSTAAPTASPTLSTAAPTVLPTIITAEQDLSLVGLVALVPVAVAVGAVAYCKFIKPPATAENVALQAPSSPV